MKVVLVWWITCLIWSRFWLFIKLGVRDLPPFTFAGLRLIVAVAVLVPFILIRRVSLPRGWRDWRISGDLVVLTAHRSPLGDSRRTPRS